MKSLIAAVLRLLVRPILGPTVPVSLQRWWIALIGVFLLGPRGYKTRRESIAGVATTFIEPASARPGFGVLYLHGGGYIVGGPGSHTKLAAHVGESMRSRVWLPDYRLAPEYVYPAALRDAYSIYAALIARGQDPARLALAGDSAGGGLALSLAIAIRDAGLPQPAALLLFSPWVDLSLSGATIKTHVARDALLKPSWLRFCAESYCGDACPTDPGCSPLFANLSGLPPIEVHVGTEEILFSDAERLVARARDAGVDASLSQFDGVGHVFQVHAGLLPEAGVSLSRLIAKKGIA